MDDKSLTVYCVSCKVQLRITSNPSVVISSYLLVGGATRSKCISGLINN